MNTVEIIKASVGPLIVLLVAGLTYFIITGNVTEKNSFGLPGVVAIISSLATAYAIHYYGQHSPAPPAQRPGNGSKPAAEEKKSI